MTRAHLLASIARDGFAWAGAVDSGIVAAGEGDAERASSGDAFAFPAEMVLPGWQFVPLSATSAVLEDVRNVVNDYRPKPILLVPPMASRASLPPDSPARRSSMELHEAAAYELAAAIQPGAVAAVLLPASTLVGHRGLKARHAIFAVAQPLLVTFITGLPGIHPSFEFALVHLRTRVSDWEPLRVFSVGPDTVEADALDDLRRLLLMQGGRSRFGYVVREPLPLEESLAFQRHDPLVLGRRGELRAFGPVLRLGNLVETVTTLHAVADRDLVVSANTPGAAPVVTGRQITREGLLDLTDVRDWAPRSNSCALREGDIVVRSVAHNQADSIPVAEIKPDDLPLVGGSNLTVLRPRAEFDLRARHFVAAFLRSPRALELLRAEGATTRVSARHLLELEVPMPDPAISAALEELAETSRQFNQWRREADVLARSVFSEGTVEEARLRVLQSGAVVRQRARAAALMDDLSYRIRARYPFPIAYRWRTVEAASGTEAGVRRILQCAEVALCYSAMVALVFARAAGLDVKYLVTIRDRLAERRQGTNLGDWTSILCEVRDSRAFRAVPSASPFAEIRDLLSEPEVEEARKRLAARRNDEAHMRDSSQIEQLNEFDVALADLSAVLDAAGFLADYTLTHVLETRWDSLRNVNTLSARELMGDHSVVPRVPRYSSDVAIERGSLYLVDRERHFHLVRPLLIGEECPTCGNWSTFHLDTFDPALATCTVKSLEHGHTMERPELVDAFRAVHLLA